MDRHARKQKREREERSVPHVAGSRHGGDLEVTGTAQPVGTRGKVQGPSGGTQTHTRVPQPRRAALPAGGPVPIRGRLPTLLLRLQHLLQVETSHYFLG